MMMIEINGATGDVEGHGTDGVCNGGKYAGKRFSEVFQQDLSYVKIFMDKMGTSDGPKGWCKALAEYGCHQAALLRVAVPVAPPPPPRAAAPFGVGGLKRERVEEFETYQVRTVHPNHAEPNPDPLTSARFV